MTTQRPSRLVLLDGMRGIAAIGVVLFHAELSGPGVAFSRGYLFVDLFFLLSGFVLALAFEPRFAAGLATGTFLRQRLRRFLPLIASGAFLGVIAVQGRDYPAVSTALSFLVSAVLIPLPMNMMFPLNPPQWSLMIELVANVVHARWLHRIATRRLLLLALACATGFAVLVLRAGDGNLGAGIRQLPAGLLRAGWCYVLGIVLARVWTERRPLPLADWRVALLAAVAAVSALPFLPLPIWAGDLLVVVALFPALFWVAASAVPTPAAERLLTGLGAISFPLYAVHFPILRAANDFVGGEPARAVAVVIAVAAAAAIAITSARLQATRKRGLAHPMRPIIADA